MTRTPDRPFTLLNIAAYGGLAAPLAFLGLPMAMVLPLYFVETFAIGLSAVGAVFLISRLWDGAADLIVGAVTDRWGRSFRSRAQLIFLGTAILWFAVWVLMSPGFSGSAVSLTALLVLAYTGWTLVQVPYLAWSADLSANRYQRTRLIGGREAGLLVGTLLACSMPWFVGNGLPDQVEAIRTVFAVLLPATAVFLIIGLRGHEGTSPGIEKRADGSAKHLFAILGEKSIRRLLSLYFWNGVANALPATLFLLYLEHVLGYEDGFALFLSLYLGAAVIGVPGWVLLSKRWGKRRTWLTALLWAGVAFAAAPFLGEGYVIAFAIVCLVSGLALGGDLVLPGSLQADQVDRVAALTGAEQPGLLFGLWSLTTKLSLAIAIGLGFGAVDLLSGDAPDAAVVAFLYGGAPVLIKAVVALWLWHWIQSEKAAATRPTTLSMKSPAGS